MRCPWFGQAGVELILIGSGGLDVSVAVAKSIDAYRRLGVRMLVDPSPKLDFYRAVGARHSLWRTLTWTRWENFIGVLEWPMRALFVGGGPLKSRAGDSFQQGATLVVNSADGSVRFRLLEEAPGYPKINKAALNRAVQGHVEAVFASDSLGAVAQQVKLGFVCALLGASVALVVVLRVKTA